MPEQSASYLWVFLFVLFTTKTVAACPTDWILFDKSCYRAFLNESNYVSSRRACEEINASLAASDSPNSLLALYTIAVHYKKSFWISGKKGAGFFPGVNQTAIHQEAPTISAGCNYVAPVITSTSSCEESKGYICQTSNIFWKQALQCPEFSTAYESSCFWQMYQLLGHESARSLCESKGGYLADMTYPYKVSLAKVFAVTRKATFWVGNTHQEFHECMRIAFDGTNDAVFQWATDNCTMTAYPLCEMIPVVESSTAEEMPIATEKPVLRCPEGIGFKELEGTDTCYWETTYETTRQTWAEARVFCQRYGGDLASYDNFEEETFALGSAWGHNRGVWIGLRRYPPANELRWVDGTSANYTRWATGEPKLSSATKHCVMHSAEESTWALDYCGVHRWFVCEAPKALYTVTPKQEAQPEETDNPCKAKSDGPWRDWTYFDNHCYMVESSSGYSWEMAKLFCADNGAHLVSIHSYNETDFLLGMMNGNVDFWIGLHSRGLHSSFSWVDDTYFDFVFWDEDKDQEHYIERCITMQNPSGYWSTGHCNLLLSVICKKAVNVTLEFTTSAPVVLPGFCPDHWYTLNNKCYKPFGYKLVEKETWSKASAKCLEKGATLASVHNQKEQDLLSELVVEIGFNAWIGLYAAVRGSLFHWVDNSTIDYTNWNEDEPYQNNMAEDCVEMIYSEDNLGRWNDIICTKPKSYICQRPKDPSLSGPGIDPRVCTKPPSWSKLGSSCFTMFDEPENFKTWLQAQSLCRTFDAHLVTLKNYGYTIFLRNLISGRKQKNLLLMSEFWIGAREREEGTYAWLLHHPLSYTNWMFGQPQEVSELNNCVAINEEGKWLIRNCNEKLPFVCEFGAEPVSTSVPKDEGTCPNATLDWHNIPGNYCYMFAITDMQTWNNAMHICFLKGGFLASLHSKEDLAFIAPHIQGAEWPLHIGLGQREDGTFAWVDGSPVNFVNWQEGEPNSLDELCVEMHSDVLTWNDVKCSETRGYICSVPKVFSSTSASKANVTEYDDVKWSLTIGGIIGIIVCVLVVVAIIAVSSYYLCPSTRLRARRLHEPDTP